LDGNVDTVFVGILLGTYVGALDKVLVDGTSDSEFAGSSEGAPDTGFEGEAETNVNGK
jgi:hypothetical protein